MTRDLTKKQFADALARNGIAPTALGYYRIARRVEVYARNGGCSRREQLAYLLKEQAKIQD